MSTVPHQLLTEQEYLARERKASFKSEFYRGEMFAMAGATREHNLVAGNCFGLLWQGLSKRGCEVYQSEMKVRIEPNGLFAYPDVVAACGKLEFADDQGDVLLNPLLIGEVLSESTADYDRGFKGTQYRKIASLREFLLIEQGHPLIEHYSRRGTDAWLLRTIEGMGESVVLDSLELTLSLSDIYAQVVFPPKPRLTVHPKADAAP